MKKILLFSVIAAVVIAVGCTHTQRSSINQAPNDRASVVDRLNTSSQILNQLVNTPDNSIPENILARAKCVAVVPEMIKGGFVVGGQHGRGEVTCRTSNGWTAPAFITITGGSWGAQIGAESVDLVLLFMNDHAVQSLLSDNVKLGGEAGVAAGPIGREAQASTDLKLSSEILAYSRTKGLFAGLDLSGAAVRKDKDSTLAFYNRDIPTNSLLAGKVQPPAGAENFIATVRRDFAESQAAK